MTRVTPHTGRIVPLPTRQHPLNVAPMTATQRNGDDMNKSTAAPGQDPDVVAARGRLSLLLFGRMSAQVVATATRLGVMERFGADATAERTADELAAELDTDPRGTLRLLRAMAALELLTETAPGRFTPTPTGAMLSPDRPGSFHTFARMFSDPAMMTGWDHLADSVRTGRTSFEDLHGKDVFTYMAERPELSAQFNAAMAQGTRTTAEVLPGSYDFSRHTTVVDIGGGNGTLIAAVLRAHPGLRGKLLDTEKGIAEAQETLAQAGVADRCSLHPGDFFAEVPAGGDVYMLKSVLHDWYDEECATILRNTRAVIPDDGRLLMVERLLPDTVDPAAPGAPLIYLADLNMLTNVGGQERTRAEFAALCERTGFRLTDVTPLPPGEYNLIEAVPV